MAIPTLTTGDVVRWRGSLHVIAGIQSGNAALCLVLPTRTVRHRADIQIEFPDTLHLGLVDGALIRCKPFVFHNAGKLTKDGALSPALLCRVYGAIGREMDARRVEAGCPKYLVR
ncbi:hypothetical protein [Gluconobacter kanchanaburiensis]|uniref:Uncharacterized protein n=1 Tax=Gluconobacter kanchanaburiensis NBRC 103587 TaxID=1307948 RepID=A0A511B616_9PROT|nr:hypothetical protein [Gluconobacter kanchanaburiensis]MBF0861264.1 hypothetical protein [Gluconobacter kanchanaburiensis]GBR70974.1 hypothetical protein AA103587_2153 [Gluconobacter kanchanaburiensis NBRC 103587]GEK95910.1 hypothetical protein GKA01_11070 [Gluconobacter kanchanaburiensis NBRC 103587]